MVDKRHQRRALLMQSLFAATFTDGDSSGLRTDPDPSVVPILAELETIDTQIQAAAPERPLHDINKVDLAILRLVVFESIHKQTPKKVLVNEAIELAKEFGSEMSSKFVNGVLAKLLLEE